MGEYPLNSLTVAVVTYGGIDDYVKICLKSLDLELRKQDRVVVIHEGSKSEYRDLLEFSSTLQLPFECFRLQNEIGLSNGRNLAINLCKTEWIAFIDDDAEMHKGWRASLAKGIESFPESVGFTGPLFPIYETGSRRIPRHMEWIVSCNSYSHRKNMVVRNGYGANMVFNARKSKENSIFFDPDFGAIGGTEGDSLSGEETIFSIKLSNATGRKIMFLHDLTIGHHVPKSRTTLSYVLHRSIKEGRTKAALSKSEIFRNPGKTSLSKEIPHLLGTIFLGIPAQIVTIPIRPISAIWNMAGIITMILGTGWGYMSEISRKNKTPPNET